MSGKDEVGNVVEQEKFAIQCLKKAAGIFEYAASKVVVSLLELVFFSLPVSQSNASPFSNCLAFSTS